MSQCLDLLHGQITINRVSGGDFRGVYCKVQHNQAFFVLAGLTKPKTGFVKSLTAQKELLTKVEN